ncbi:MAG: cation diffusion facilitator family transporter [Elusimicrobiota bacterium]
MDCGSVEARNAPVARSLYAALAVNALVCAAEFWGSRWASSLALAADAAHNAVDCAAIALGIFAYFLSRRPPDARRTFGYRRVEVLAALANGLGLWIVAAFILRGAYLSRASPAPVKGYVMLGFSCLGLVMNAASGLVVYISGRSNINARAVFFHLFSDALSSVAAVSAALVIIKTGWMAADAAASAAICVVIIGASFSLIGDAVHILLEGVPEHLDPGDLRRALEGLSGVSQVHDLHVWSLTQGSEALSGHLVVGPGAVREDVLGRAGSLLRDLFGISHVTLQIEREDCR